MVSDSTSIGDGAAQCSIPTDNLFTSNELNAEPASKRYKLGTNEITSNPQHVYPSIPSFILGRHTLDRKLFVKPEKARIGGSVYEHVAYALPIFAKEPFNNPSTTIKIEYILTQLSEPLSNRPPNSRSSHATYRRNPKLDVVANQKERDLFYLPLVFRTYALMVSTHNKDPLQMEHKTVLGSYEDPCAIRIATTIVNRSHPISKFGEDKYFELDHEVNYDYYEYTCRSLRPGSTEGSWLLDVNVSDLIGEFTSNTSKPESIMELTRRLWAAGLPVINLKKRSPVIEIDTPTLSRRLAVLAYLAAMISEKALVEILYLILHTFGPEARASAERVAKGWQCLPNHMNKEPIKDISELSNNAMKSNGASIIFQLPEIEWSLLDKPFQTWEAVQLKVEHDRFNQENEQSILSSPR